MGRTTDNGVGKLSHAGLRLSEDINSSANGFCAILSMDVHERRVYPSHMEGQRSHGAAQYKCILVNRGQAR